MTSLNQIHAPISREIQEELQKELQKELQNALQVISSSPSDTLNADSLSSNNSNSFNALIPITSEEQTTALLRKTQSSERSSEEGQAQQKQAQAHFEQELMLDLWARDEYDSMLKVAAGLENLLQQGKDQEFSEQWDSFLDQSFASVYFNVSEIYEMNLEPGEPGYAYKDFLGLALEKGAPHSVKKLLSSGARISPLAHPQQRLLQAVKGESIECLQILLDKGIDLHQTNAHGQSALHLAALKGHASVIVFLLEKGADSHLKDRNGLTPKDGIDPQNPGAGIILAWEEAQALSILAPAKKSASPDSSESPQEPSISTAAKKKML